MLSASPGDGFEAEMRRDETALRCRPTLLAMLRVKAALVLDGAASNGFSCAGIEGPLVESQRRCLPVLCGGEGFCGVEWSWLGRCEREDTEVVRTGVSRGVSGSAEPLGESCQARRCCALASLYSSSVSQVSM